MRRKFLYLSCGALVVSVGLFSFTYRAQRLKPATTEQKSSALTGNNSQSDTSASPSDEYIAYRHVFAHIYSEAKAEEKSNQDVNAAIELYRNSVPLSENEAKVLLARSIKPRQTSATVGNNVSYAPGLLHPFFRGSGRFPPNRQDHRDALAVAPVLVPEEFDQIALFQSNADKNVGSRYDGEEQMTYGHHRRSPKRNDESQIEGMPHELVKHRCSEARRFCLFGQIDDDLLQPEQLEMIDQKSAEKHDEPAGHRQAK